MKDWILTRRSLVCSSEVVRTAMTALATVERVVHVVGWLPSFQILAVRVGGRLMSANPTCKALYHIHILSENAFFKTLNQANKREVSHDLPIKK